jgi:hypothetical protein
MTEYELLYLIVERRSELINLIQWWGAISIGVIASSHFIDRKINMFVIILIVVFYIFFSLFAIRMVFAFFEQLLMAFTDLAMYADSTESVSQQTQAMIVILTSGRLFESSVYLAFVMCGLTIATCSYPIWRYWECQKCSAKKNKNTIPSDQIQD